MRYALLIPLLLASTIARGQDSPAERIAPYLTETAVAVGRVDVDKIDIDRVLDQIGIRDAQREGQLAMIKDYLQSARNVGIGEVYAVVDLADIPEQGVYLVIPTDDGKAEDVLQVLKPLPFDAKEVVDGAIVAGSQATIERLKNNKPDAKHVGLADAFAVVGEAPVQIVVAFTPDQRRALREMLPNLPEEYGNTTGEQLAAGLTWAALGLSYDPALGAKLVIQSESEQAAETLKTAMTAGLRRLSTQPDVLSSFPLFPMFVGALIPERQGTQLVLNADKPLETVGKLFASVVGSARREANQSQTVNNLKQIGLAMHNFHDKWGSFPPRASYDDKGQPLLSWRVFLLPFLDEQALYEQFRLDEPWDSEHNKALIEKMPEVFRSPTAETPPGHTVYLAPTGEGLVFDDKVGTRFQEITDGTSNTILVVEATADKAVPWTKPEDLPIDPKNSLEGLRNGREIIPMLFGDGSVHRLSVKLDPKTIYKAMTRAGGEVIYENDLHPE